MLCLVVLGVPGNVGLVSLDQHHQSLSSQEHSSRGFSVTILHHSTHLNCWSALAIWEFRGVHGTCVHAMCGRALDIGMTNETLCS